ncbi:MAG: TIGR04282 family arsenosugar biosynthesis glycosyltransferase [Ferruginibacter sp.]
MSIQNEAIIIFVRNPVLGLVKTRIAAKLGSEVALKVYVKLLKQTHEIVCPLTSDKFLFYVDGINHQDLWENHLFYKRNQVAGDLGVKMQQAFKEVFEMGYQRALIIGSDCYDLTTELITEAFEMLKQKQVVIGPAVDGGYYLLGMQKQQPSLFVNIEWSTSKVLEQTFEVCEKENLLFISLPTLSDVDEADDVRFLY